MEYNIEYFCVYTAILLLYAEMNFASSQNNKRTPSVKLNMDKDQKCATGVLP